MMLLGRHADRMTVPVGTLPGLFPWRVCLQPRDGVLVHGPTGSGKTWSLAYWLVMRAPGSCLVTTTGGDLVASTWAHRKTLGDVHIFDPEELTGVPGTVRWSPLSGCQDPGTAIRRAEALTAAMPIEGTKNGGYFESKAAVLMRCYLHAAAVTGRSMRDVKRWANNRTSEQPRSILEASPIRDVSEDWSDELATILDSTADSSHDVVNSTARLLAPLAHPDLMRAVDVPAQDGFQVSRFLTEPTTLYLVSEGAENSMAPFVAALAAEILHQARTSSQRLPGKRHDPFLSAVLDEVNNIAPVPRLPSLYTDVGKRGISLWGFAHSQAQNLERWGQAGGRALAANTPVRLILPGIGDVEELEALSRLVGREHRWVGTPRGGQMVQDYKLPPDRIRELPRDHGLLLYRGAPPIMVKLPNVWRRRGTAARVRVAMREFETRHTPAVTEFAGV